MNPTSPTISELDDFFAWLTNAYRAETQFEHDVLTAFYDFLHRVIEEYKHIQKDK